MILFYSSCIRLFHQIPARDLIWMNDDMCFHLVSEKLLFQHECSHVNTLDICAAANSTACEVIPQKGGFVSSVHSCTREKQRCMDLVRSQYMVSNTVYEINKCWTTTDEGDSLVQLVRGKNNKNRKV